MAVKCEFVSALHAPFHSACAQQTVQTPHLLHTGKLRTTFLTSHILGKVGNIGAYQKAPHFALLAACHYAIISPSTLCPVLVPVQGMGWATEEGWVHRSEGGTATPRYGICFTRLLVSGTGGPLKPSEPGEAPTRPAVESTARVSGRRTSEYPYPYPPLRIVCPGLGLLVVHVGGPFRQI